MKKTIITVVAVLSACVLLAQAPQAFKYQAIVRDNSGETLQNQIVGIRINIHEGSALGEISYQETHTDTTNQFGLINLEIGNGVPTYGAFSSIDWSTNSKFIETEIDPAGGTTYISLGTSELLSVPYALYSERSKDVIWNKYLNDVYYDNGNVGVGITDPIARLHIKKNTGEIARFESESLDSWISIRNSIAINGYFGNYNGDRDIDIGTVSSNSTGKLHLVTQANPRMTIDESGKVGIKTLYPDYPLHIKGFDTDWLVGIHNQSWNTSANGLVIKAEGGDPLLVQNIYNDLLIIKNNGRVGIGTSTPDANLHVNDRIIIGEDPNYIVYGEIFHEGGGTGLKINAEAEGGGWADLHFQTNGVTKMFLESGGNVGIGTTSPTHILHVNGIARSTQSTWATSSDVRVKENIHNIEGGVSVLEKLRPVTFNYINEYISENKNNEGIQRGFIAQEVEEVLPDLVTTCKESYAGKNINDFHLLSTGELTPILVAAIKEQQEVISNLEKRIELLEQLVKD